MLDKVVTLEVNTGGHAIIQQNLKSQEIEFDTVGHGNTTLNRERVSYHFTRSEDANYMRTQTGIPLPGAK